MPRRLFKKRETFSVGLLFPRGFVIFSSVFLRQSVGLFFREGWWIPGPGEMQVF